MAKKGIDYFAVAKGRNGGTDWDRYEYTAVAVNFTPATSNVKDYGNNHVVEVDSEVIGGTLSVELNRGQVAEEILYSHDIHTGTYTPTGSGGPAAYTYEYGHDWKLNEPADIVRVGLVGYSSKSTHVFEVDPNNVPVYTGITDEDGNAIIGPWVAKVYWAVQFSVPNDDNETRGESAHFGHTILEGEMLMPSTKIWRSEKRFATKAAAIAWVKDQLEVSA